MNGAAEALLVDLLAQATTQTQLLQRLVRAYTGSTGTGGAGGGGSGGGASPVAGAIAAFNPLTLAVKAVSGAFNILGSLISGVVTIFGKLMSAAIDVTKRLFEFGKAAMTTGVRVSDFFNVFGGLPIIGKLFQIASSLQQINEMFLDSYRSISTVGATFGGDLFAVQRLAAQAGLTLGEFVSTVTANSENLATFGGTTEKGAVALSRMNRALLTSADQSGKSLLDLGVKFDEAAGYLSSYMGLLGRTGQARNMTDEEVIKKTRDYVFELDALTRLTGISRQEADKQAEAIRRDATYQAFLATLNETDRAFVESYTQMAAMVDPQYAEQVKATFAGLPGPVNDVGMQMLLTGNAALMNREQLMAMSRGLLTAEDRIRFFSENTIKLGQDSTKFAGQNNVLMATGAFKFSQKITELGNKLLSGEITREKFIEELLAEQARTANGTAGAAARAELSMRDMGNGIMNLFMPILRTIYPYLMNFATWLSGFIEAHLPQITAGIENALIWLTSKIGEYTAIFNDPNQGFKGVLRKMWTDVSAGARELWPQIRSPIMNFIDTYLTPWWDKLMVKMNLMIDNILDKLWFGLNEQKSARRRLTGEAEMIKIDIAAIERQKGRLSPEATAEERARLDAEIASLRTALENKQREIAGTLPIPPANQAPPQGQGSGRNRHSGTIGMTGNWWEKESGPLNVQAGETVLTQSQLAQIVDTAGSNKLAAQVERLNSISAEMLVYLRETAQNTRDGVRATKGLNGNVFA